MWLCAPGGGGGGVAVAVHPQRRLEEPQAEEEEEEEELVSNCQPIGLHSSAVCGGELFTLEHAKMIWVSVCPKQASLLFRYFSGGADAFVVCGPVIFSPGHRG